MKCPVCEDVDLAISSREGVEIDFCAQCRGVWLDRGELDKIIDRVAAIEPLVGRDSDRSRRSEPANDDRYDERSDPRRRRRRGFLDDIFDFD